MLLLPPADDPATDVAAAADTPQCVCGARDTHPLLLQAPLTLAGRVAPDTAAGNTPHAPTVVASDAPAKSMQHEAAFGVNLD